MSMSGSITMFHEILFSGFRGVALTNCFSGIFNFWSNFQVQKGQCHINPRKKIESKLPANIMSYITTKFHEIMLVVSE